MRDGKDWLAEEEESNSRAATYEADKISRADTSHIVIVTSIATELAYLNANLCAIGYLLHSIDYNASFMIDIVRNK